MITNVNMIKRYEGNPILKPDDMPSPCCAVYNSGVVKLPDGTYVMMSRFEAPNKKQMVWTSRSTDGVKFIPDSEPVKFVCKPDEQELYDKVTLPNSGPLIGSWYDPRICPVGNEYYVVYCVGGDFGCRIAIGKTKDFKTVEHVSFPLHVNNRNAVLFPEKINGEYWMLHRPQNTVQSGCIWIASSPDLKYWGNCEVVAQAENYWENTKIGPAAPPIKTDKGWLIVYHGVFPNCNGINYGCGVMMLDLDNPRKVIGRCKDPIMFVKEPYEMIGQVPNVIFPGGVVAEEDGTVKIYYGAADYVQCLATTTLEELIEVCFNEE